MEQHHVTVIINGRSYGLNITVNNQMHETFYEVVPDVRPFVLEDFSPQYTQFTADHTDTIAERIRIVETEQIARIIWTEILNKMG
ncbi:hypothetical protein CLV59_106403 [Chitinophaga dinghuensis]|uniref:Uncharacterized protein n=1 Tax=Chitinophaga dinghuensis TaxID=1539050 RepID=A0A327VV33_9BACT|nr:hypothetical protein [Chitinophaga dinghuensis]RAJ79342.1 hypothetical protein CLV59_106403 [Chitinophaga dinghuensis]